MSKTGIEWTKVELADGSISDGETLNPLSGCSKCSEGCEECYAIKMAWRLMHIPAMAKKYEGTVRKTKTGKLNWTGRINYDEDVLQIVIKKKKPTTYFVNSMSDLFHENVPFEFIDKCFHAFSIAHWHVFQILTKRAKRMAEYYQWKAGGNGIKFDVFPLPNVWQGVSIEKQKYVTQRLPYLLTVKDLGWVAMTFLSCEPLLEEIDISRYLVPIGVHHHPNNVLTGDTGAAINAMMQLINPKLKSAIDQVIVGGESGGKNVRPMKLEWVRSLKEQCRGAGVCFFFKQTGTVLARELNLKSKKGGDISEWPVDLQIRQTPKIIINKTL